MAQILAYAAALHGISVEEFEQEILDGRYETLPRVPQRCAGQGAVK